MKFEIKYFRRVLLLYIINGRVIGEDFFIDSIDFTCQIKVKIFFLKFWVFLFKLKPSRFYSSYLCCSSTPLY